MSDVTRRAPRTPKPCQIPGCQIQHTLIRYGMCPKHYYRQQRHGSPHAQKTITPGARRHWLEIVARSTHGDECIDWPFKVNVDGYGTYQESGIPRRANRRVMELTGHHLKSSDIVCHTCHNRRCVNPRHLYIGTNATNTADAVRAGRMARGPRNANAVFTEDDVREIRRRLAAGHKQRDIATDLGVSQGAICGIATGRSWGWLA
jgi:hypothetical protein